MGGSDDAIAVTMTIEGLQLEARIGVYSHEKRAPQPLILDVELELSPRLLAGAKTDCLEGVLDYDRVGRLLRSTVQSGSFDLQETLCLALLERLLALDGVLSARVKTSKPVAWPDARAVSLCLFKRKSPK